MWMKIDRILYAYVLYSTFINAVIFIRKAGFLDFVPINLCGNSTGSLIAWVADCKIGAGYKLGKFFRNGRTCEA